MVKTINVQNILNARLASLSHLVPGFLVRKLEKIIHQKDLNTAIHLFGNKTGLDFVSSTLDFLEVSYNLPANNPLKSIQRPVVVSNHPLGGLDALVLMDLVGKTHPKLKVFANDLLMNLENLSELFVPVNKHGSNKKRLELYHQVYQSDVTILHFPAGLCSRKKGKRVRDLSWEKSFVTLAKKYQRPIVPMYFDGFNSNRFYSLATFRRWFGIPFNLEMLFLVDEMFKQKGKRFSIHPGKPWYLSKYQDLSSREITDRIKNQLYRLSYQNLSSTEGAAHA